jgi:hypothetical protein
MFVSFLYLFTYVYPVVALVYFHRVSLFLLVSDHRFLQVSRGSNLGSPQRCSTSAVVVSSDGGEISPSRPSSSSEITMAMAGGIDSVAVEVVVAEVDSLVVDSVSSPEQERLDEETLLYYQIRSQRRKKGTLKSKKNSTLSS